MRPSYVYILASRPRGALYVGMTDDLPRRVSEHKSRLIPGHTRTYQIDQLVWYEEHEGRASAHHREHQIKRWRRAWKENLIEGANPIWLDLYEDICR